MDRVPRHIINVVGMSTGEGSRRAEFHLDNNPEPHYRMVKLDTYGLFGRPYSRDFIDSNGGEFLPVAAPGYVVHCLLAG